MDVKATIHALDMDGALAEGLAELGRLDPVMARLVAEGARPALRKREPGFHGLAWIVIGQQLSVASADAIWNRLVERECSMSQPNNFRRCHIECSTSPVTSCCQV
jgi:3-methyladenine DNA glycosylase/8-oxoguanine DNA glycosylase